jgi:DNA (cytosine-5)-methyltransferase 1
MTHGSLFTGIGGIDLGFEWAGIETVWQVETDPYAIKVLEKRWPDVRRYEDVRKAHGAVAHATSGRRQKVVAQPGDSEACGRAHQDGHSPLETTRRRHISRIATRGHCPQCLPPVDIISGGFPCQDISVAGKGAGIAGSRSGLWSEMLRICSELRPRYVLVENVPALTFRGLGVVLGQLSEIGYDAEWQIISAADVGAPHLRKRIWIISYPNGGGQQECVQLDSDSSQDTADGNTCRKYIDGCGQDVADATQERMEGHGCAGDALLSQDGREAISMCDGERGGTGWWSVEPDVGRVAHGVPSRVDRLKCLGNAVVPHNAYLIGRLIVSAENGRI